MKNSSPDRAAAAIEELLKGREFVAQLGALVRTGDWPAAAGGLIDGVMSSLSRAIDALEANKASTEADRDSVEEVSSDGKKRKSSGGGGAAGGGGGRGGFRKR